MPHTLNLGFIDNPTIGTDDAIGLGGATSSCHLDGYDLGNVQIDEAGRFVRNIKIDLQITGASVDAIQTTLRQIERYIYQTKFYFDRLGGTLPSRSDGAWHSGLAAVLTFQSQAATKKVYWNVLDGSIDLAKDAFVDALILDLKLNVTVNLVVEASARGDRAKLDNLIKCGGLEPPFCTTSNPAYTAGWTLANTTAWVSQTTGGYYGPYCLRWSATGASTTSYATVTQDFTANSDKVLGSIWLKGSISAGTLTVRVEYFASGSWSTLVTFTGLNAVSSISSNWTQYLTAATLIPTSTTNLRIAIISPSTGTISIDGVALWRNPVNDTVPVEFVSAGNLSGNPAFYVYNAQGDTTAPLNLMTVVPTTAGGSQRVIIVGGQYYDTTVEYPIPGLGFDLAGTTTASTMYFGALGQVLTGTGTTGTFAVGSTHPTWIIDYRPRMYRAFLIYAANDAITISKVTVTVGVINKSYTVALPNTFTGNTTPTAGQYAVYDLGDFFFRRPGIAWDETQSTIGQFSNDSVTITHTSSANRQLAVAGVIMLPADQFGTIDLSTATTQVILQTYNEADAPVVGYNTATVAGSASPVRDLSFLSSTATLVGGEYYLAPSGNSVGFDANHYEILFLTGRTGTNYYTFDASLDTHVFCHYTPRYTYGVR